jgi:DNA mismatch repair protein MutL
MLRDGIREALSQRAWIGAARPGTRDASGGDAGPGAVVAWSPRSGGPAHESAVASDWLLAGPHASADAVHDAPSDASPVAPQRGADRVRFGDLRLLGQLHATYLVLEGKEQLLLVDQHAAHERVLYERLRSEWLSRGVERQGLLAPVTVELEPRVFAELVERRDEIERLGFDLDAFGERTVAVRSVPALLSDRDPAALVRGLGDELADSEGRLAPESAVRSLAPADRWFATLACHRARRKGDVLDPREQRALIDALDAIPWAPTCPHGRPVAVPLELAEIERRFGRR